jgi:nitrate reductase NapAB chaperone NapD
LSIRSFLVHIKPGRHEAVAGMLRADGSCDVYLSENADLLVVVTDHTTRTEDDRFDERLTALPDVMGVALVSGYGDGAAGEEP